MGKLISDKFAAWQEECEQRFQQLKANEEELNRIFIENIPFFRCGTEYIDLLLIRAVGIQAGAEFEIRPIVRTQLAAVRGTVRTFASGDHMVHGVLNMAQSFVSLVAHLASPRFSSGAIRSL